MHRFAKIIVQSVYNSKELKIKKVKMKLNELSTRDGLEFCPDRQGTNYKFAPVWVSY